MVNAQAQENVPLKAGAGRDVVEGYCGACHSLDYPRQNVLFLNRQGWETEVNKMNQDIWCADPTCRPQGQGDPLGAAKVFLGLKTRRSASTNWTTPSAEAQFLYCSAISFKWSPLSWTSTNSARRPQTNAH
jgi:hypothetical protein